MEIGLKKKEEKMGFEETELRLGLPGNRATATEGDVVRKRGFSETESDAGNETTTVDLMLNLSSNEATAGADPPDKPKTLLKEKTFLPADPAKPPAK